ncbi:MAG: hypothetical protein GY853_13230 [PVC group bacterium]|nr:hypothetical protein [PVC group bacterium]
MKKRPQKWGDDKEKLFATLWPKYVSGKLTRPDIEGVFGIGLDDLRNRAYKRKLATSQMDNYINSDLLKKIRKAGFDV